MNWHSEEIEGLVRQALAEDVGAGDATTTAIVPPGAPAKAKILARQMLVCAGLPLAENVFRALDREMRIGLDIPIAQLLAEYEAQCARYRELVASLDLDMPAKKTLSTGETVTLRWILSHLIEETARHNGHIDILREMADGVTGT